MINLKKVTFYQTKNYPTFVTNVQEYDDNAIVESQVRMKMFWRDKIKILQDTKCFMKEDVKKT
jgi:hypothetical protein